MAMANPPLMDDVGFPASHVQVPKAVLGLYFAHLFGQNGLKWSRVQNPRCFEAFAASPLLLCSLGAFGFQLALGLKGVSSRRGDLW